MRHATYRRVCENLLLQHGDARTQVARLAHAEVGHVAHAVQLRLRPLQRRLQRLVLREVKLHAREHGVELT